MCPGVVQAVITLQESWNRAVHEETRLFIALFWCKKVRFFFNTTTQGGHAMKKYWKYSKEQLRDVFSTTEQGLSEKHGGGDGLILDNDGLAHIQLRAFAGRIQYLPL